MATNLLPPDNNSSDLGSSSKAWKKIYVNEIEASGGTFDLTQYQKLVNQNGWAIYADSEVSPATQIFDTTPQKLSIDSFGSNTNVDYLPLAIRGTSQLWDDLTNRIAPIEVGDSYELRVDLEILAKTGSPTFLDFNLDIGGAAGITISIVERIVSVPKTPPYNVSFGFPIFSLDNFYNNGGQLFFATDTGTVEIGKRSIMITRISTDLG